MSGGTLCPRARCPGGHSARGDILPSDTGSFYGSPTTVRRLDTTGHEAFEDSERANSLQFSVEVGILPFYNLETGLQLSRSCEYPVVRNC